MKISKILYFAGGKIVQAYSRLMFRMSINSQSGIPGGAKIIVANHPTTTDPFVLTSISNGQAAILIKDILFDIPVFGRYLHMAGHIPVSKEGGKEAFENALEKLKSGITVIVFIEGTVSGSPHILEKAKTGAVRLAMLSGRPIIPIGIGVRDRNIKAISSVIKGVQEWGKWYLKGPYALTVGKPISLKGSIDNRDKIKNLSNWLRNKISLLERESTKSIY